MLERYLEKTHPITGEKRVGPWYAEICGSRFTLKYAVNRRKKNCSHKRGEINIFTKQARFRMLKRIAEIDWSRVGPSLFLTLTYPDSVAHNCKERRNQERYLFLRRVEMRLGRRICGLWRVEYKSRRSGDRQGEVLAHMHMLLFGVNFLPAADLRHDWQTAIDSAELPRVDVQRADDGLAATKYIAKYCGKVGDAAINLVKVTYLNNGRHYGYHRARHIPLHPVLEFPLLDPAVIHYIRVKAGHMLKYLDLDYFETFTLLGDFALKCAHVVDKKLFDIQHEFGYSDSMTRGDEAVSGRR